MYNEKTFKLTIILTKIRRYLFVFLFVAASLVGAYFLSQVLIDIFRFNKNIVFTIMPVTGVLVFIIAFVLTSDLSFKVQQAQLEMKTLRKLNLVSYKLDKILQQSGISISDELTKDLEDINTDLLVQKSKKFRKEKI